MALASVALVVGLVGSNAPRAGAIKIKMPAPRPSSRWASMNGAVFDDMLAERVVVVDQPLEATLSPWEQPPRSVEKPLSYRCVAEFVGTAIIVLACSGLAMLLKLGSFASAVVAGLAVGSSVFAFGSISGAHFNPAITLALLAGNNFPRREVPAYVFSQSLGAICAHALVQFLGIAPAASLPVPSFFVEAKATLLLALLCFAIGEAVDAGRVNLAFKPFLIGAVITMLCITFGAGMNPAISAAPRILAALLSGTSALIDSWQYAVAPCLGALSGSVVLAFALGEGKGLYYHMGKLGKMHRRAWNRILFRSEPLTSNGRVYRPKVKSA